MNAFQEIRNILEYFNVGCQVDIEEHEKSKWEYDQARKRPKIQTDKQLKNIKKLDMPFLRFHDAKVLIIVFKKKSF